MSRSIGSNRVLHVPGDEQEEGRPQPDDLQPDESLEEHQLPPEDLSPPLIESVRQLSSVVGELKSQITYLVRVNEAQERDLEQAREQVADGARDRERLILRIETLQHEARSVPDLKCEIDQLYRERDALADKVEDMGGALTTSEQRVKEVGELLDRFRTERNDASEEANCLDSQFSRAMKVISELRKEMAKGKGQESDQLEHISRLQIDLQRAVEQRDNYRLELQESRNALEEVRRSILEASRGPG